MVADENSGAGGFELSPSEMAASEIGASEITLLLKAWAAGDAAARDRMAPLVYEELRAVAGRVRYRAGRPVRGRIPLRGSIEDTLQTSGLVHEAWLRLVGTETVAWQDRAHFFAVAAQLMRRILVDRARSKLAAKRGGLEALGVRVDPDEVAAPDPAQAREIAALDDALEQLAALDPRRARIVELRVFAGLTVAETAEVEGISEQSVMRAWKVAKAWLMRELGGEGR